MLHAVLLAAALTTELGRSSTHETKTPLQQCLGSMDGPVYHGDPTDSTLMKTYVTACIQGAASVQKTIVNPAQGPEKLFITGRVLDRAATLSFMGLNDARSALAEVKKAHLYFRIAASLPEESATYHAAAVANVELTGIQLQTLHAQIASTAPVEATIVAKRTHHAKPARRVARGHRSVAEVRLP